MSECSKPLWKKIARQPLAGVTPELEVVLLARQVRGADVADAAPALEPAMQHAQLWPGRRHESEANGGADKAGAVLA